MSCNRHTYLWTLRLLGFILYPSILSRQRNPTLFQPSLSLLFFHTVLSTIAGNLFWHVAYVILPFLCCHISLCFKWVHTPNSALDALFLVDFERLKCFLSFCHLYRFQLIHKLCVPFPYFLACSRFDSITFIRIYLLILVLRCASFRITSILPRCASPFPITLSICVSHAQLFEIYTPRYAHWSTVGTTSLPRFYLNFSGFSFSPLHKASAHLFTFAVPLHSLLHCRVFSICF